MWLNGHACTFTTHPLMKMKANLTITDRLPSVFWTLMSNMISLFGICNEYTFLKLYYSGKTLIIKPILPQSNDKLCVCFCVWDVCEFWAEGSGHLLHWSSADRLEGWRASVSAAQPRRLPETGGKPAALSKPSSSSSSCVDSAHVVNLPY